MDAVRAALTPATRLVALTHGSNVLGVVNDAAALGEAAMGHGAILLLDASQTAGVVPIDVQAAQVDLVAFPGHKGCFGPMGTGALYVRPGIVLRAFREGGTGFGAESELQPEAMPFHLEGGTPNAHGLAGLAAGLEFLEREGVAKIGAHERDLALCFAEEARRIPGVTVWSARTPAKQSGPCRSPCAGENPRTSARPSTSDTGSRAARGSTAPRERTAISGPSRRGRCDSASATSTPPPMSTPPRAP